MGVFRQILSTLNGMWKDIKELKAQQSPEVIAKAKRFDEINESLKDVHFSVSSTSESVDDKGNKVVKVYYDRPVLSVTIDENGEPIYNKMIVAMNNLNLIQYGDMLKIDEAVSKAKVK